MWRRKKPFPVLLNNLQLDQGQSLYSAPVSNPGTGGTGGGGSGSGGSGAGDPTPGTGTEDLMNWVILDSRRLTQHYASGSWHYLFGDTSATTTAGRNFAWIKASGGNPWDINHYDNSYIYFWITENGDQDPTNPSAWKRFVTPVPIAPRYYTPGSPVTILSDGNNPIVRTINCGADNQALINIGHIKGYTEGPYSMDWGGDVGVQDTIIINYFWGGTGSYSTRERQFVVKNWGRVSWDTSHWNGSSYTGSSTHPVTGDPVDSYTIHNTLTSGGSPDPNFACGYTASWWTQVQGGSGSTGVSGCTDATFSDDFSTLDNWIVSNWSAPGGGQFKTGNVDLTTGMLRLTVTQDGTTAGSVGGEIQSKQKFGYGDYVYVMRASSTSATPTGTGQAVSGQISSGFNFLSNSTTEIDAPEIEGNKPHQLSYTSWTNGNRDTYTPVAAPAAPESGFHEYKFRWIPGLIEYYFDGNLMASQNVNVPTAPAFMMFNHWGTNSTGWGGFATPNVIRYMYVKSFCFTQQSDIGSSTTPHSSTISWNASVGATSYNVKRANASGGPYTTIANVPGTSYTDYTVASGHIYYYVISALNSFGESANSSEVTSVIP